MNSKKEDQASTKIASITMLRGIACLAVCFMHFSGTLHSEHLNSIAKYGAYGVPIFFAISGFILPYSMDRADYRISNFFRFFAKRIVRIEPAYIVSIIGVVVLSTVAQFSSFSSTEQISVDSTTWFHLLYLIEFVDGQWLNPVYWTLAIEFQFYILIGLIFPFLNSRNLAVLLVAFVSLCSIPLLLEDSRYVIYYLPMFLPGLLFYWYKSERISPILFAALVMLLGGLGYYSYDIIGPICTGFFLLFIIFVHKPWRPLVFIGTISYSLYLIHTIIGTDGIINFMQNYITDPNDQIWLTILTFPIVVFITWVFYLLIERPSIRVSKRIKY